MAKKEGFTWFERLLRKYATPDKPHTAFSWNRWTVEERIKFFDEFPIASPTTYGRSMVDGRERMLTKQWDELNKEEQQSVHQMYCVWDEKHIKSTVGSFPFLKMKKD